MSPPETVWVGVTGPNLSAQFRLSVEHLDALITWLAERKLDELAKEKP